MSSEEEKAATDALNGMMRGMLEGMATKMETSRLVGHVIEEEAHAWDTYIGNAISVSIVGSDTKKVAQDAIVFADAVLVERRKRFGIEQMSAKMTSTLETMNEKCGMLVGSKPCSRAAYHEGACRP